jgi:hypothetical protein
MFILREITDVYHLLVMVNKQVGGAPAHLPVLGDYWLGLGKDEYSALARDILGHGMAKYARHATIQVEQLTPPHHHKWVVLVVCDEVPKFWRKGYIDMANRRAKTQIAHYCAYRKFME